MPRTEPIGRLNRAKIVAAVTEILEHQGVDSVSTRTVGEALGVHPTALYRHFRDMDELLREAADGILAGVVGGGGGASREDGFTAVGDLCRRIRDVLMEHPGAARVMASGPSRMQNERMLTERMLGLLAGTGLSENDVVLAYHALIEFTVGSAAVDTLQLGDQTQDPEARHRAWRADYLTAAPDQFPHTTRFAAGLYPSLEDQFEHGLELMITGLRQRVPPGN